MSNSHSPVLPFYTVAMAEILLIQDLLEDASHVLERLLETSPDDDRVKKLAARIWERKNLGELEQRPMEEVGHDNIELDLNGETLDVLWELTDDGLAIARRKVRYSGHAIVRLFTAATGPRGVRTTTRDLAIEHTTAGVSLGGFPRSAVHVAAVGFLGRNGAFVPLARSLPRRSSP